ncbi:hypothetical protein chiPu_0026666 [Chiloscyllium punctatum]|uniref:Uncharacterized protein n=1 Tax=Chiloscyllium punctatum TaxID=137246 RepID=A0A401TJK7_CHIPU|nr:hypothetical protein [Chiloscyllium punctatum]
MSHRCTVLHLLLFAIGLVPYSSGASQNFYRHGVAFNSSSAICIPARDNPDEVDTFFNAWLEVLPDIQTICLLCTSERDPRPTCLRRAEGMDLGGCMFGSMCAMPDDLTSAPAFDAFAMRDLSVCGYYEPTNAAVISLYLCFSPRPQPHQQQPRPPRYYHPLSEAGSRARTGIMRGGKFFMITSDTRSWPCWSIYRASGYRNIAQHRYAAYTQ